MDNLDKIFKGQQNDEEFVVFFRQHWIVLIKEFFYFAVLLGIVAIAAGLVDINAFRTLVRSSTEMKLFSFVVFAGITFFFHRFFMKVLNYYVNVGVITNKRLIRHQKTLFFRDTLDAVDLDEIENIERSDEGFLPNVLGYGDIKVYLSAATAVITFSHVRNAKYIFRAIGREKEIRNLELLEKSAEVVRNHKPISPPQRDVSHQILEPAVKPPFLDP